MNLSSTAKAVRRALWGLPIAAVIGIGLTIPVLATAGALSVPSEPVSPDSDGLLTGMAAPANAQGSISAFVTVGGPDSDGDGFPDSADGCPATPTVWPTPIGDDDCDGWLTSLETVIGTNPLVACGPGAWPPDFNDDHFVNIFDVNAIRPPIFNLLEGKGTNPFYSERFDLNADEFVNIFDVNALRPPIFNLLVPCTP